MMRFGLFKGKLLEDVAQSFGLGAQAAD